jgi:hypothetical protein
VAQNAQSICYRRLIKTPDRISFFFLRVNVRYWHKADNPTAPAFVRYWRHSGHNETPTPEII